MRFVWVAFAFLGAFSARAGSSQITGTTNMLRTNGEGETIASGDWVSEPNGGLGTFYSFFIEVPTGLATLAVDVFDSDIGAGDAGAAGGADNTEGPRDLLTTGSWNTTVTYSLRTPTGAQQGGNITCNAQQSNATCVDNNWARLFTVTNPAAGHWELRVDMGGGDETTGFGVRAHDGNAGAGGTELPVYALSYLGVGPTATTPQSTTMFPWVTSGCQVRASDFDLDAVAGSQLAFNGSAGFAQTVTTVSGGGLWATRLLNQHTTDNAANNYGVWTYTATVARTGGNIANMGTTTIGAFNMAVPGTGGEPNQQPEPLTFRLYFPQDSGAAPVKPKVEQFVFNDSGPNPPVSGQQSVVRVRVVVTNPTTRSITFSATNNVTMRIPGAPASYGGNAVLTQGALVGAEPAIGAQNVNLVWNPGTVAAGTTATFSYRVRVTPTSNGQRIAVTGTPAANGTTATYRDETGNTTQAAALATFGPLCEVAVTSGTATRALIADVRAVARPALAGGGLRYQVQTTSEIGTIAFTVQRFDDSAGAFVDVTDKALPAFPGRPQGRLLEVDESGVPVAVGDLVRVRVVEEETGGIVVHGPFDVVVGDLDDAIAAPAPTPIGPTLAPAVWNGRDVARSAIDRALSESRAAGAARAEVRVLDEGVQRVRLPQIAAALDVRLDDAASRLAQAGLALARDGVPVPYVVVDDSLVFWGTPAEDRFERAGVYELTVGPASLMAIDATPILGDEAATARTVRSYERDQVSFPVNEIRPDRDFWMWAGLAAGYPGYDAIELVLEAPDDAGQGGTLTLHAIGSSANLHEAAVIVNGVDVGTAQFPGTDFGALTFALPASAFAADGALHVTVRAQAPVGEGGFNAWFLERVELEHAIVPRSGAVLLGDGAPLAVPSASVALDVTFAAQPRVFAQPDLAPGLPGTRVTFAEPATMRAPLVVRDPAVDARALRGDAPFDVAILTVAAFADAAAELAQVHAARGHVSRVFLVEDLYDAYGHGRRGPAALRAFLVDAVTLNGARYAVIAGSGSMDERDVTGLGDALIPVPMHQAPNALAPFDFAYADPDGDGTPDLAVGRIPATSAAELAAYAARLAAAAPVAAPRLVVASDDDEADAAFASDARDVAETLPLEGVDVALGALGLAGARAQLQGEIAQGADVVLWVGHGGLDRLANEGLLTSADVAALEVSRGGVFVGLTCNINRFDFEGYKSLGEELVLSAPALAVVAPAQVAIHDRSQEFGRALGAEMARASTVGAAFLAAQRAVPDAAAPYLLLGDPTVALTVETIAQAESGASCATTGGARAVLFAGLALCCLAWRGIHRRRRG